MAILIVVASFAATILLTELMRRKALRYGLLDVPNARSSHHTALPRGGGLAIVLVVLTTALTLLLMQRLTLSEGLAWLAGGSLIAFVGLLDDRGGLSVRSRLLVQSLVALSVVWSSDGVPLPFFASDGAWLRAGAWVAGIIATLWAINLFNFMDGIDGLAAAQVVFAAGAAWLLGAGPPDKAQGWMLVCLMGASAGFLVWNWSPARIFMGDVGSGFLGFALALSALSTIHNGSLGLCTWLILQGLFIADATTTLIVRALRGERIQAAHRQHMYQRLARYWGSHAKVSGVFVGVNVLWLLPCAVASVARPELAGWLLLIALIPLFLLAILSGAGQPTEIGTPHEN
jgi:Fuc2NAc and GlcNAc transferase